MLRVKCLWKFVFVLGVFPTVISAWVSDSHSFDRLGFKINLENSFSVTPHAAPELIELIQQRWSELPRTEMSSDDLIQVKYWMQAWRLGMKQSLLNSLEEVDSEHLVLPLIESLRRLQIFVSSGELDRVGAVIARHLDFSLHYLDLTEVQRNILDSYLLLRADQSLFSLPVGILQTSPLWRQAEEINAFPEPPSEISLRRVGLRDWSRNSQFSHYHFTGEGLVYRGLYLKSGDLLFSDSTRPSAELFSIFLEPHSHMSHIAVFVILDIEGEKFPAVLETATSGVYFVPLSTYLHPKVMSYIEVYRNRDWAGEDRQRLGELARTVKKAEMVFDLQFEPLETSVALDSLPEAIYCAAMPLLLMKLMGDPVIQNLTSVNGRAQENLRVLGLEVESLVSASDFLRDGRFEFVGVVDNGFYERNFLRKRELLALRSSFFLENIREDLRLKPRLAFAISRVQSDFFDGRILGGLSGFKKSRLPRGRPQALAAVRALIRSVESRVQQVWKREMAPDPQELWSPIEWIERGPRVGSHHWPIIESWFEETPSALHSPQ